MIRMLLRVLGAEYSRPVRRTIALMATAALLEGASYALLVPVLRALLSGAPSDAVPWLAAFAGAVAVFAALRYAADLSGFLAGSTLLRGMYHRLGDHLARLPIGWFGGGRTGEVSVLAGSGVLQAMSVIAHHLAPLVSATVTPLATVAVMLAFDWRLGLAALAAVPAVVAAQRLSERAGSVADAARAEHEREAADRTIEYIRAQPVLRAGGRSRERFGLLDDALRGLQQASRRSALTALPGALGLAFTVQAAFTALLVLGAFLALGGGIGAAELLCVLVLAARCTDPVLSLAHIGGGLRAARGELDRLDAVLRAEPLPEPSEPVRPDRHDLAFEAVSFRRGGRTVLDGVDLAVPEGGRLAVVGPSGAGKSTLLQLIARFHDVDTGSVRVGGADVRAIGTDILMARISIVFQDVFLFDGTIEQNVLLGRPDADAAAVREAARAARLDEVVERLPDGWATNVGEGGALLSGGERQRVSIARALLKDTPIVLLDEVTSALDPHNEGAVHAGIERLMAGRTVVLVTHRLQTAVHADRIVFLEEGRVVEAGTHDELVRLDGRYADFWRAASIPAGPG